MTQVEASDFVTLLRSTFSALEVPTACDRQSSPTVLVTSFFQPKPGLACKHSWAWPQFGVCAAACQCAALWGIYGCSACTAWCCRCCACMPPHTLENCSKSDRNGLHQPTMMLSACTKEW